MQGLMSDEYLGKIRCPFQCTEDLCIFSKSCEGDGMYTLNYYKSKLSNKRKFSLQEPNLKSSKREDATLPVLLATKNSKFSWKFRQTILTKIYETLRDSERAIEIESELHKTSNTQSLYKIAALKRIEELKKNEIQIDKIKSEEKIFDYSQIILSEERIKEIFERNIEEPTRCDRCRKEFQPDSYYNYKDREACRYHYGRMRKVDGIRMYSCCQSPSIDNPCTSAPLHVYKDCRNVVYEYDSKDWSGSLKVCAIDCEMVYTTLGMEVARISIIDECEETIMDTIVHPKGDIVDLNTRYSGVRSVEGGISFDELIRRVKTLISSETTIIGHGLDNDFAVLKLRHCKIVDTAVLYSQFYEIDQRRPALRDLARIHLQTFIQEGSEGHDSVQDCIYALRLAKLKI